MRLVRLLAAAAALIVTSAALPVRAANIVIGLSADVTAIDPHYHNLTPNNAVATHLFDFLVARNEKSQLMPGLATEWKAIEPTVWEFKLRKGVKFSDGSDFTAADVVASIERVPKVPKSPSPFTAYTKQITKIDVVDPYTIRFRTAQPYPLMPSDMVQIAIVSKAAAGASTDDFNTGKAAIGTGPYKLVRYAKGDRIELVRNDNWWGGRTPWDKVTLRLVTNDAARVAALLSGDVQAIENVPTADVAKLRQDKRLALFRQTSDRLMYVHMDSNRDVTPMVSAKDGKPLATNPLKDPRVRRALSLAINRQAIVERLMDGSAQPASQLLPQTYPGTSPRLKPDPFDLARAPEPPGLAPGQQPAGTLLELDWRPLVAAVLADLARGAGAPVIAARFHNALAGAAVALAAAAGLATVVLTGGCFQNRRLAESAATRLRAAGFEPWLPSAAPVNDGGVALGQIAVAAARLGAREGA